jgi:hypothetical protein
MMYGVYRMTLVQAQIPEAEYRLLRQRAGESGKPMKEIIRLAIHDYLADDQVQAEDPIFHMFPLGASGPQGHRTSEKHDDVLFPKKRR